MATAPLFTIGYEQATTTAFFAALAQAKVGLLVDVRAVAASRRPGFSKRQLAAGLDQHGIGYVHLQKLGTPKEGRLAARSGQAQEMLRIFERHLATPDAQRELDELTALAATALGKASPARSLAGWQGRRAACCACYAMSAIRLIATASGSPTSFTPVSASRSSTCSASRCDRPRRFATRRSPGIGSRGRSCPRDSTRNHRCIGRPLPRKRGGDTGGNSSDN
jgi:hypothetical protein